MIGLSQLPDSENVTHFYDEIIEDDPNDTIVEDTHVQSEVISASYQNLLAQTNKLSDSNRVKFANLLQSYLKHKRRVHKRLQQSQLFSICTAKTSIGTICNRKCAHVAVKYCPTHINNPKKYDHVEKKCRPEKIVVSPDEIDMNDYFITKYGEFEGQTVLIDNNGFIYDKRDFTILARILIDQTIEKF